MPLLYSEPELPPIDYTSDLDRAIAAEEHKQGRGYRPYSGHCDRCEATVFKVGDSVTVPTPLLNGRIRAGEVGRIVAGEMWPGQWTVEFEHGVGYLTTNMMDLVDTP